MTEKFTEKLNKCFHLKTDKTILIFFFAFSILCSGIGFFFNLGIFMVYNANSNTNLFVFEIIHLVYSESIRFDNLVLFTHAF